MITFACHRCETELIRPDREARTAVECPACGAAVLIPAALTARPPARVRPPALAAATRHAGGMKTGPPAPRRVIPWPVWAMLGVFVLTLLVCGGGGVVLVLAYRTGEDGKLAQQRVSRTEFKKAVLWRKPAEALQAVGRPDKTVSLGRGKELWYYRNRTYDPITGRPDDVAIVTVDDDVFVANVSFH